MRLWAGQWQDAGGAEPAIAPRAGAITMTAPQVPYGTIIWGGVGIDGRLLNDGVMVDRSGYTRLLPAAPICPRRDFAWADDHFGDLVIYGGYDQAGTPLNDGAVCSSDPGTWTLLAPSPLPPGTAVMAGDVNDMAVLARDLATGLPTMAHLRRNQGDSGRWELVPAVPLRRATATTSWPAAETGPTSTASGWTS